MPRAECIWCGEDKTAGRMVHIHSDCFFDVDNMKSKIEYAKRYAEKQILGLSGQDIGTGHATFLDFLQACDDFSRRWANSMKLIQQLQQETNHDYNQDLV